MNTCKYCMSPIPYGFCCESCWSDFEEDRNTGNDYEDYGEEETEEEDEG